MSTRDWKKIEELFGEALTLPPPQRSAFLDARCGAQSDMRREVEHLLENDARADADFLRTPPPDPRLDAILAGGGPDELLGRTIGSCRVKKVLAQGGMGTVYLADQLKPRREVALKVMHGGLWSRSARRRFEYESQVLARLHHPHIAQVYEAGTAHVGGNEARTLPYFVMEYVPNARTITQHAEEYKLSTRERLELFIPICKAVQHGHQKGIIHRDLKPENILVDADGRVKIIDFGVARSVDSDVAVTTMHTAVGDLIGTLAYMSPEQCDANPLGIDTRSDVYALGVVLYELICGRLPYDVSNTSLTAAARVIREEMPQRPGTIDHNLRGDLETILLKTLDKDREKRYTSAADLAQDIQRHLNREPIEARPPTAWTRAVRWTMRHPVASTAGTCSCFAVVILAATFIAVWFVNSRPHEIVRFRGGERVTTDDQEHADEARLLSFAGGCRKRWGGAQASIAFAELVKRPAEFGGGKLAVIGYSGLSTDQWRGSLCAYEVDGDLDAPVWSRRIETDDILPELRQKRDYVGDKFISQRGKIADVFCDPDHPGDEFIAIFAHATLSQRVIRIYDLGGTLLYQVWHEGGVGIPGWMSAARLLVFSGDNAFVNWDRRGNLLRDEHNPMVVFALRPEPDHIGNDWLQLEPGGNPGSPVWYKCLYIDQTPATKVDIALKLIPPPFGRDRGRFVDVNLHFNRELGASLRWTIDGFGEEVSGSRELSDPYQFDQASAKPKLPDPDAFHLGPMPPIVPTAQPAEASSSGENDRPD